MALLVVLLASCGTPQDGEHASSLKAHEMASADEQRSLEIGATVASERDRPRSGSPEPAGRDEQTPRDASVKLSPSVSAEAGRARVQERIASGNRTQVDRVQLTDPVRVKKGEGVTQETRSVLRLRVTGQFSMRAERVELLVDGVCVGFGVEASDGRSVSIALGDESLVRVGARVAYSYGSSPATEVGTVQLEGRD